MCQTMLHCATPCHAMPCRAMPEAPPYLELRCLCSFHGVPVPEPLVLGRGVAKGCALQRQRVPLSQAARPWLLQDLQPCHARAVAAGWGRGRVAN